MALSALGRVGRAAGMAGMAGVAMMTPTLFWALVNARREGRACRRRLKFRRLASEAEDRQQALALARHIVMPALSADERKVLDDAAGKIYGCRPLTPEEEKEARRLDSWLDHLGCLLGKGDWRPMPDDWEVPDGWRYPGTEDA